MKSKKGAAAPDNNYQTQAEPGFHFISYTELLPGHEFRHSEVFRPH